MDNVIYERCPYCFSKDISETRIDLGATIRVITKCNNVSECGSQIDVRVIDKNG